MESFIHRHDLLSKILSEVVKWVDNYATSVYMGDIHIQEIQSASCFDIAHIDPCIKIYLNHRLHCKSPLDFSS